MIVDSMGNRVRSNRSTGNGAGRRTAAHPGPFFDLADTNLSCAFNRWAGNVFGTSDPACIREPSKALVARATCTL